MDSDDDSEGEINLKIRTIRSTCPNGESENTSSQGDVKKENTFELREPVEDEE
jgi:hypothetical protein